MMTRTQLQQALQIREAPLDFVELFVASDHLQGGKILFFGLDYVLALQRLLPGQMERLLDAVASRGASLPVGYSRKCPCDCGVVVPANTPAVALAVASPCRSSSCHGRPRIPLAPTGIAGSGPAPLRGPWSDPAGCRQTHDGQSANHPS